MEFSILETEIPTIDLVAQLWEMWAHPPSGGKIDPDELAGVVDLLYDNIPSSECQYSDKKDTWTLVELYVEPLKKYLVRGMGMETEDWKRSNEYSKKNLRGFEIPPIFLSGGVGNYKGKTIGGIALLDGRHRIFGAIRSKTETIPAFIPASQLPFLKAAGNEEEELRLAEQKKISIKKSRYPRSVA